METKVYRVVAVIGRKRKVLFESTSFSEDDGLAEWRSWKDAERAREMHLMNLWNHGYQVTTSGSYYHYEKKIDAGRFEVIRCTK